MPRKRVSTPEEIPMGAWFVWIDRDGEENHYIRVETPPELCGEPIEKTTVWGKRIEPNTAGLIGQIGNLNVTSLENGRVEIEVEEESPKLPRKVLAKDVPVGAVYTHNADGSGSRYRRVDDPKHRYAHWKGSITCVSVPGNLELHTEADSACWIVEEPPTPRVVRADAVPMGARVRLYAGTENAMDGTRVERPRAKPDGAIWFEWDKWLDSGTGGVPGPDGKKAFYLQPSSEVELLEEPKPALPRRVKAKDVPIGGVYRFHRKEDPAFWWKRCEPPPGADPELVWARRPHEPPEARAYSTTPFHDVELLEEPPMIDILTASKGQLVEEAVRKFGPEARENALRTRLEQLREALQENEAPAWWSIGAGNQKVRPQPGGGDGQGKGQGQGQGNQNIIILGRDESKHQAVDLKPQEVAKLLEPFFNKKNDQPKLDEAKVAKMVDAAVKHHLPKPVEVKVELPTGEKLEVGKAHRDFPRLVKYLSLNLNVMLVGPAGSFKTSSAERAAEALKLPFYMTSVGMQTSKADLLGYQDAHGKTVRTHLRNAYENGGVFLLDEVDAGNANVLTVINALLANNLAAFPDAMVRRHENFRFVAAGNTFGKGADRQYVGRNQLDAATLDRFVVLYWDYDEEYELEVAGSDQSEWVRYVQRVRAAVTRAKVRQIISPRASIFGATMLRAGLKRPDVEEAVLWTSMTADDRQKVKANIAA